MAREGYLIQGVEGIYYRENDCGHGLICSQVATQRSSLDQLSNWRPYVLHPDIINAIYATDALRDIIYECTFCKFFKDPTLDIIQKVQRKETALFGLYTIL